MKPHINYDRHPHCYRQGKPSRFTAFGRACLWTLCISALACVVIAWRVWG
jgi:hypothetical protein